MDLIDFSKEKKKPTKKKPQDSKQVEESKQQNTPQANEVQKVDYDQMYQKYLERITNILRAQNPNLALQTSIQLEKPQLDKQGSKKIIWKNFETICKQMKRDAFHVHQYFLIELGTEGSLTDGKLLIRGRYNNQNIESLIKKYLHEYVMCGLCKSSNTTLEKDTESRLYNKECKNCKASNSVSTLKMQKKKDK